MREFTVTIETPEDTTRDEDVLERFHDAITDHPNALDPSAALDTRRGTIISTFQVEAPGLDQAQYAGIQAFVTALRTAGLDGDTLWRIVQAGD